MLRVTILFAVGLCANVLVGLPARAQAPAELTLTRIDCGTGATPVDVGQRFIQHDMRDIGKLPAFPAAGK